MIKNIVVVLLGLITIFSCGTKKEYTIDKTILGSFGAKHRDGYIDRIKLLKEKYKLTVIFVSHDLSIIKSICDRVIVLKNGNIVESNDTDILFSKPSNDYTKKLISSVPSPIPIK